ILLLDSRPLPLPLSFPYTTLFRSFLSFSLNDFPRELGKSYGEMLLLDHAFAQSNFVRQSKYVAKITGRNFLQNLTTMLEEAPTRSEEHTSELQSHLNLVCRLLLEK